ncbi:hypothetical protein AS9A_3465 [Hoyosella subflava DQS3-9A1]|uniref:Uncharacterized protein n=1 Tax=Hoyosella subflava (strain DSM 45089 / JCM 17490 / NBRC 109087 / DQS3-9A1) TaxID=443218 RepID=F6EQM9_HOYSD|nr:hypothetical protein AS9A_3465 [Hoyosella subflava DQS3-9A1]
MLCPRWVVLKPAQAVDDVDSSGVLRVARRSASPPERQPI